MLIERAKRLQHNEWVTPMEFMPNGDKIVRLQSDGETPTRYRVTRVKTWKRDPNRIEIAVRYGVQKRTNVLTENDLWYWHPTDEILQMIEAGTVRAWPYRSR